MQKLSPEILSNALEKLEVALKNCNLWQAAPPTPAAFMSPNPFCYDTMRYEQWLQWIFIPKLRMQIEENLELPIEMSIVPMAEEVYKATLSDKKELLEVLGDIDKLFVPIDKAK